MTIIIIAVVVVVAAIGGASIVFKSSTSKYSCLSVSTQGGDVQVSTSGLIHIDGTQYYVTCAEGAADLTAPATYSCLTISPQVITTTYPDNPLLATRYYLDAGDHTITVSGTTGNETEISPGPGVGITIAC